jgi:hypothetical protein
VWGFFVSDYGNRSLILLLENLKVNHLKQIYAFSNTEDCKTHVVCTCRTTHDIIKGKREKDKNKKTQDDRSKTKHTNHNSNN